MSELASEPLTGGWFVLLESNTTGTGRDFAVAAMRHGLRPVLLARDPAKYGYATELGLPVREVDTTDPAAVEAECRQLESPGAVGVTSSSEYFIQLAAMVAVRLGLRASDPQAIGRCRDKAEQRRVLRAAGVPVPDFVACETPVEAAAASTGFGGGPVVVKPVYGTGSQGVRRCTDPASVGQWAEQLLADTHTTILVEREVTGPEFSVEIIDGEPVGITRKHIGAPPYFVETGHDFPARLPVADAAALNTMAARAVHAIGHLIGPAHVELRLPAYGQPTIIEINPRLAGGLIPRLVQYATGRDLVDEVVAAAAGLRPATTVRGKGFASIRFLIPKREGRVVEVTGVDSASELPGIVEAECRIEPGADLVIEHSFVDRKGHVVGASQRAADAIAATERAIEHIRIRYADELANTAP